MCQMPPQCLCLETIQVISDLLAALAVATSTITLFLGFRWIFCLKLFASQVTSLNFHSYISVKPKQGSLLFCSAGGATGGLLTFSIPTTEGKRSLSEQETFRINTSRNCVNFHDNSSIF